MQALPLPGRGATGLAADPAAAGRAIGPSHHLRHVDGLRAVAVLAVVGYHAGAPFLRGGYVGVDVFFVISGFLITGLLLRELEGTGRVDLLRFYARRARRLLPAASVVVLTVAAVGALLLPPVDRGALAVDVAAAALFVANWRYVAASTDYSAAEVGQSPLLHFWSLAVEEQYYLVWPLLLLGTAWVAARRRWRRTIPLRPAVAAVLGGVLVVSLWLSVTLTATTGTTAYFGLHTRAWELALGGLLAVALPLLGRVPLRVRPLLVVGGLAAIAVSAALYTPQTPFPSWTALLPTLGAAAVVVGGLGAGGAGAGGGGVRLLESRVAVGLGLLSYSWYLWHWPVLRFASALWGDPALEERGRAWGLPLAVTAAAVLVSLLLAVVSYRVVEQPLRLAGPLVRSSALSLLLGLTLVATGVAAAAALRAAVPQEQPVVLASGEQRSVMSVQEATVDRMQVGACDLAFDDDPVLSEDCTFGAPDGARRVLLLGDSHARHWLPALDRAGEERGWQVELRTKSGCNPVDVEPWLDRADRPYRECVEWREVLWQHVADSGPYDLVVVGRTQSHGREVVVDGALVQDEDRAVAEWGPGARRTVERLLPHAERVVVLGDNPAPGFSAPSCLSQNGGREEECTFDLDRMALDARLRAAEQEALADLDGVDVVDVTGLVCGTDPCRVVTDEGVVKFQDGSHLTATFARSVADGLADLVSPG